MNPFSPISSDLEAIDTQLGRLNNPIIEWPTWNHNSRNILDQSTMAEWLLSDNLCFLLAGLGAVGKISQRAEATLANILHDFKPGAVVAGTHSIVIAPIYPLDCGQATARRSGGSTTCQRAREAVRQRYYEYRHQLWKHFWNFDLRNTEKAFKPEPIKHIPRHKPEYISLRNIFHRLQSGRGYVTTTWRIVSLLRNGQRKL